MSSMSDDEGPDLLVEIFDLVGLYTKADDPRLALQSALRRLAAKCASFESKSLDELSDSELADIEVEATNVQQQIAAYRETIRRAKSESFQLSQEITQLPSFSEVLSWQLLAFSLLSVLQKHLVEEAHALDQLEQSLDCLYADDGFQTIELVCTCLDRRSIREAFVFREASKALQEQLANQVSLREIAGFDDAAALGQTPTSSVSFVPSHGDVCNQKQIMDAVRVFLGPGQTIDYSTFTSLLVVGPEGSGKSHVCDQVERVAQMTRVSHVIRPRLPLDLLGKSVGETEDLLVSLLGAVLGANSSHVIVILDDIDVALVTTPAAPETSGPRAASHFQRRCQAAVLNLMDSLREHAPSTQSVLFLCTAASDFTALSTRVDRTYFLEQPQTDERRLLVESALSGFSVGELEPSGQIDDVLEDVAESSAGRSHAELTSYFRSALENCLLLAEPSDPGFKRMLLDSLRTRLLSATPASLKAGVLEDSVDMRVLNSRELGCKSSVPQTIGSFACPLRGDSALRAWAELEASIVVPLCCASVIQSLMNPSADEQPKSLAGGVLLEGKPASGKSTIAYECAKYCASVLPSLKLLDVSCTTLIHKEVGGSERAIHNLFAAARRAAPCIVLLEGIENIAAVRGNDPTTEGTLDRVLSTLLVELDGVDDHAEAGTQGSIGVIGITPDSSWIDPALKRPGRLAKALRLEIDWRQSHEVASGRDS